MKEGEIGRRFQVNSRGYFYVAFINAVVVSQPCLSKFTLFYSLVSCNIACIITFPTILIMVRVLPTPGIVTSLTTWADQQ